MIFLVFLLFSRSSYSLPPSCCGKNELAVVQVFSCWPRSTRHNSLC